MNLLSAADRRRGRLQARQGVDQPLQHQGGAPGLAAPRAAGPRPGRHDAFQDVPGEELAGHALPVGCHANGLRASATTHGLANAHHIVHLLHATGGVSSMAASLRPRCCGRTTKGPSPRATGADCVCVCTMMLLVTRPHPLAGLARGSLRPRGRSWRPCRSTTRFGTGSWSTSREHTAMRGASMPLSLCYPHSTSAHIMPHRET